MNNPNPNTPPPTVVISDHSTAFALGEAIIEAYSSLTHEQYDAVSAQIRLICDLRTPAGQIKATELFGDAVAYYVHGERR